MLLYIYSLIDLENGKPLLLVMEESSSLDLERKTNLYATSTAPGNINFDIILNLLFSSYIPSELPFPGSPGSAELYMMDQLHVIATCERTGS